jgi:ankyrin repeat protein
MVYRGSRPQLTEQIRQQCGVGGRPASYGEIIKFGWGEHPNDAINQEVESLYERRILEDSPDDADLTPLHIAVFDEKMDIADVLIENGADVNLPDKFGLTPLHTAAMRGNVALVRLLVQSGALPAQLDRNGKTPAAVAMDNVHQSVVNFFEEIEYYRRT